ncbi:BTAD domain-containing putative transcriptional regulator [Micromonospora sp. WMMD882]|uniref:AfsR/SARP family transcriptional regulator n=1 Tax=Micromonospora sp. WMMD882 TaxID=3015151 RepID=UPI00248CCA40|nr:AfsR/SARP family transcriptional regulator [Micromonospora sp. WMMD882]WBB80965.1 BTAD domain-containing putative transcriptional regulator [Micromonospora sp. WMMD882]
MDAGHPNAALVDVAFRILGPVEIGAVAAPVRIPPGRQQVILAALLLDANRVVGMDTLIDLVWGERPPTTARSQVQICVSALRAALAPVGLADTIVTRAPGYLIRLPEDSLDLGLFRTLVGRARAARRGDQLAEAADLLRRALALWRGPALGGEIGDTLRGRAVHLDEERLGALEECIDVELQLGRHHRLSVELGDLVASHPLRERLRGQLMIALYRSGRAAEALEAYRAGRQIAIDELGIEAGEQLRRLETAILTEDPSLRLAVDAASPGPARLAPHQLPADISDFTGRDTQVAQVVTSLVEPVDRAVRVVVVAGKAGVGKTALAVHAAHLLAAGRFPDGQLYCNLAGMQHPPADPTEVLARFLRALGLPGASIPEAAEERADLYRTLLADRRVLVVLDDAATERQIAPLLPGSDTCAVIVTSRTRLTGIAGARLVEVGVLDPDPALGLLTRVIGVERVSREPVAARTLVQVVGGLPLALRIVAARLSARTHWSLASMVGRLADERHRLDELAHGDMMVRASLTLTYDGLDGRSARLFRLLGLAARDSVPPWVAAALLGDDLRRADGLLDLLVDTQLLDVRAIGLEAEPRYAFHDIIRLFAVDRLASDEDATVVADARIRMLGGWLALAEQAHGRLYGGDYTVLRGTAPRWRPPDGFPGRMLADPLGWLDAERLNLCAAVDDAASAGLDELSWELAVSLVTLFEANRYTTEWERTHETALAAVRAAGNRRGEAALLCSLGSLNLSRSRFDAARAALAPAFTIFTELDDTHGLAMVWRNLASLDYHTGSQERAADGYTRAIAAFRAVGDVIGQAHALNQLARIDLDAGAYGRAVQDLNAALVICQDVGGSRVEAQVLHRLGTAMRLQGRYAEAELIMETVLEMVRGNRDMLGEGYALHALGLIKARLGKPDEAAALLRAAVASAEKILDQVGVARAGLDLAALLSDRDRDQAVGLAGAALRTFVDRGLSTWATRARTVLRSMSVDPATVESRHGG